MTENNHENMTVEETVEELKKQIQVISKESDEVIKDNESLRPEVEKLKENAVEFMTKCIDAIKETTSDVMNSEQFQKTMTFVCEKAKTIVSDTKERFQQLKNNPELKNKMDDAKDFCTEAFDKVSENLKGSVEKLQENEQFMNKFNAFKDKAEEVTSTAVGYVSKQVDEFTSKPEVNEKIEKAKDVTLDVAEKAVDALRKWLRPEEKEEEKSE